VADTYGVVHGDVSAELPGLFSGGFTANTKPAATQVTSLISTADTIITLKVLDVAGSTPSVTDKASALAKRYIVEWVKAQVVRIAYVGNDATAVKQAVDPYETNAAAMMAAIEQLGAQAEGDGTAVASRIRTGDQSRTTTQRALVVDDTQLDSGTARARLF
jgi:hypothetical protein